MTRKNIISIGIGLLISSLVSGVLYYMLFLETFDLFGIESIIDPEARHKKIFYTTLAISILTIVAVIGLVLWNRKLTAIGVGLPLSIGLWVLFTIGPVFYDKSSYYEQFDKERWIKSSEKPLKMARLLVVNQELIGLSVDNITNMLGKGQSSDSREHLLYRTDYGQCRLALTIKNNKVTNAHLWIED
jgi:hypothetical protein